MIPQTPRFRDLSPNTQLYIVLVILFYATLTVLLFRHQDLIVITGLTLVFGAAGIVQPAPHPLGGINDPVWGLTIASAVLWSPQQVLFAVGVGTCVGHLVFRRYELWRASNNGAGWALHTAAAAWAAGSIFHALGTSIASLILATITAIIVARVTNSGLFAGYRSLRFRRRFLPDFRQSATYLWPSLLLSAPLAIALAAAANRFHNIWAGLALTAAYGLALPVAGQEYSYYERSRRTLDETVEAAVRTLEGIDPRAREHGERVGRLSVETGRALGMPEDALLVLRLAARLHDIGLLAGTGYAAGEEHHAIVGSRILATFPDPKIAQFVRAHHERWDGSGTPEGRKGTETPLGARILSAAEITDGYSAGVELFSTPHSDDEVLAYLQHLRGTGLDPKVADAMRGVIAKGDWKKELKP